MSKKLVATIVVLLMVLSVFSVVSATVPAAKAQDEGCDKPVCVFLRPGVPDLTTEDKEGFSHTLGTLRNYPDAVLQSYLEYAVLTGSVGDLQFDINTAEDHSRIDIYVPPEFTFTKGATPFSVWTDITNDYGYIQVSTLHVDDPIAPNWTDIEIGPHVTLSPSLSIEEGLWHVRLFALQAPAAFGVYHFKILVDSVSIPVEDYPIIVVKGELNPAFITGEVNTATGLFGKVTATGTTPDGRSVTGQFYLSPFFECPNAGCESSWGAGYYVYWLLGAPAGTYTITASTGLYSPATSDRFTVLAAQSVHDINLGPGASPTVHLTVWSKHAGLTIPWDCLWQPPYGTNDPNYLATYGGCLGPWQKNVLTGVADGLRNLYIHIYDSTGKDLGTIWTVGGLPPFAINAGGSLPNLIDLEGVPWATAGYVSGFATGATYSVGAYVTGYIMPGGVKPSFTITGDSITLQMDLSKVDFLWIKAHTIKPNNAMTLAYTAVGSDGKVHGVAAYRVPACTATSCVEAPAIILEGWNSVTRSWPDGYRMDYGLVPGNYVVNLYAADGTQPVASSFVKEGTGWYYIKSGEPNTGTIQETNAPFIMSFSVASITLALRLRSVDWETPAHVVPWIFPGAEIWVDILDTSGATLATLDPTVWGLVQDDGGIGSPYLQPDGSLWVKWTGKDVAVTDPLDDTLATSIAPGQYGLAVHTFGYVTRLMFPFIVNAGTNGDIQADLIKGAEIQVQVHFTKEGQDQNFNGFVRVEVYDGSGKLVGANIYGQAQPKWDMTSVGSGGSYFTYDPTHDFKVVKGPSEGSHWVTGYGQRGYTSWKFYGVPPSTWAYWAAMDPSDANRLVLPGGSKAAFDVFGFYYYYGDPCSRNQGLWANGWVTTNGTKQSDSGLKGSTDLPLPSGMTGGGAYTVKVYAFDSVDGLNSYYMTPVTGINVGWGQAQLITVEMKQMGRIAGEISWIDQYRNIRNMPWAAVSTTAGAAYSMTPVNPDWSIGYGDEAYSLWLPAGTYDVSVAASGASQVFAPTAVSTVVVSDGFNAPGINANLGPQVSPVPEFPATTALALLSALSASLYLLRRKIAKK